MNNYYYLLKIFTRAQGIPINDPMLKRYLINSDCHVLHDSVQCCGVKTSDLIKVVGYC